MRQIGIYLSINPWIIGSKLQYVVRYSTVSFAREKSGAMKVLSSFSLLGKVDEAKIKIEIKMMLPLHVITLWMIMMMGFGC